MAGMDGIARAAGRLKMIRRTLGQLVEMRADVALELKREVVGSVAKTWMHHNLQRTVTIIEAHQTHHRHVVSLQAREAAPVRGTRAARAPPRHKLAGQIVKGGANLYHCARRRLNHADQVGRVGLTVPLGDGVQAQSSCLELSEVVVQGQATLQRTRRHLG